MVRAARSLLVFLILVASFSLSQATAFAQDERNDSDFEDTPGAEDSRSEDDESDEAEEQSSDAELFSELVAEIRDTEPAVGPDSGELEFDSDGVAFEYIEDEFQDFLLEVAFILPDLPPGEIFEFGVAMRVHGDVNDPAIIQFVHDSSGSWVIFAGDASEFTDGSVELLDTGIIDGFDDSAGAENTIVLLAQGPTIQLGLGDELIATIDVPYDEAGFMMISAANYLEDGSDADPVEYQNLTIWEL